MTTLFIFLFFYGLGTASFTTTDNISSYEGCSGLGKP